MRRAAQEFPQHGYAVMLLDLLSLILVQRAVNASEAKQSSSIIGNNQKLLWIASLRSQ
jgi:hypothetical protein